MLAFTHRNPPSARPVLNAVASLKLQQIAAVTGSPAVSAAAARLFAGIVSAADDDGRAMLSKPELAVLAGNGAMLTYADTLLRELRDNFLLEFDAHPGFATAIRITLGGEDLNADLEALARRQREARRCK